MYVRQNLGDSENQSSLLVLGAGALVLWFLLKGQSGSSGEYEVELYNYPKGHVDRRYKGSLGVYSTKKQADEAARNEKDFYPLVRKV